MIRQAIEFKQQGMTLIELTVVLLILTSLATVALRSTTGLVEQTRWEQTKKRYEEIKKAIIGDPKLVINDQPDISGFVADMGRLPTNIRELLSREYCSNDYSVITSGDCTGTWVIQTAYTTSSGGLSFGWHGPYLAISTSDADKFAFSDGWVDSVGGATSLTDLNYGWNYSVSGESLTLQSYGKGHSATELIPQPSDRYIIDYPENATAIDVDGWLVDISSGVEVAINSSGIGSCDVTAIPESEAQACTDAGWSWQPSGSYKCFDITPPLPTPLPVAPDAECSPSSPTPNRIWQFQANSACSDPTHTTKDACETASGVWSGCVDLTPTNSKSFCKSHGAIWRDSPSVCLRINYRTINTGTGDTETTSSWDSAGSEITTTSVRQTVVFDGFSYFSGTPPVATAAPTNPASLPAGNAKFQVFHYDNTASQCSNTLAYPATTCKYPDPIAGATACAAITDAIWDSNNDFCYVPSACGAGSTVVSEALATPVAPVIKTVIPHKAIPQINW